MLLLATACCVAALPVDPNRATGEYSNELAAVDFEEQTTLEITPTAAQAQAAAQAAAARSQQAQAQAAAQAAAARSQQAQAQAQAQAAAQAAAALEICCERKSSRALLTAK